MHTAESSAHDDRDGIALRTELRPGDLGAVVRMHGLLYAREHGFDRSFEAYVAEPLAAFAQRNAARERIWLAERSGELVGSVAIVESAPDVALVRWFLVDPSARGAGLGRELLARALRFSAEQRYTSVELWTVSALTAATHIDRGFGFECVEERAARRWGVDVVEQRYRLPLAREGEGRGC